MNRETSQIKIVGYVLAAGKSVRMGEDKLALNTRNNISILNQVIDITMKSDLESVIVINEISKHQPAQHLLQNVSCIKIASQSMSESVLAAIARARKVVATHAMILLGDMPAVTSEDINQLLAASRREPTAFIVAHHKNEIGNPVVLPLEYAEAWIGKITGDRGARAAIESGVLPVVKVECSAGVLLDIDTPQDYADYLRS